MTHLNSRGIITALLLAFALTGCASVGTVLTDVAKSLQPDESLVGTYEMKYYERNSLPHRHIETDLPLGACEGNGVPTAWEVTGGSWTLSERRTATWTLAVDILCEENGQLVQRIPQPQSVRGRYLEHGKVVAVTLTDELKFDLEWNQAAGTLVHDKAGSLWLKVD